MAKSSKNDPKVDPEDDNLVRNPQNPENLPHHGLLDGGPGGNQPSAGRVEGPDADRIRRAEQVTDAQNRAAAAAPTKEHRDAVHEARDRLEAEIVRHERQFEDYAGGALTVRPQFQPTHPEGRDPTPHTPMTLHLVRERALRVQASHEASPGDIHAAADELAAFRFMTPEEARTHDETEGLAGSA